MTLDPTAILIIDWLRQIGLTVRLAPLGEGTFLPGVTLEPGGLVVDSDRLLYPGDLLHEAGHLATMLPNLRATTGPNAGSDMGDEIAAQTWSYAAAIHLELAPEIVFHAAGYKGAAAGLIDVYRDGAAGLPLLQWMGLTFDVSRARKAGVDPYPHMVKWLREAAG
ncbi:MAG TPA: hypothetical protein VG267_05655 [Terracidiphilus sp.]|jgi:hypothetical protein|nr:hypothetical protein [Terracidiphilus sp.]